MLFVTKERGTTDRFSPFPMGLKLIQCGMKSLMIFQNCVYCVHVDVNNFKERQLRGCANFKFLNWQWFFLILLYLTLPVFSSPKGTAVGEWWFVDACPCLRLVWPGSATGGSSRTASSGRSATAQATDATPHTLSGIMEFRCCYGKLTFKSKFGKCSKPTLKWARCLDNCCASAAEGWVLCNYHIFFLGIFFQGVKTINYTMLYYRIIII